MKYGPVRLLRAEDVDAYVTHSARGSAWSGRDGDPVSEPYSKDEVFDQAAFRKRTLARWSTPTDGLDWRRCWAVFDGASIVGHTELCGAGLRSASHRVRLGMGVDRGYRRQGLGRALVNAAVEWARRTPAIAWIDLGVFIPNPPAIALYLDTGFVETGRTRDQYRVDGEAIDNIDMVLSVARTDATLSHPPG